MGDACGDRPGPHRAAPGHRAGLGRSGHGPRRDRRGECPLTRSTAGLALREPRRAAGRVDHCDADAHQHRSAHGPRPATRRLAPQRRGDPRARGDDDPAGPAPSSFHGAHAPTPRGAPGGAVDRQGDGSPRHRGAAGVIGRPCLRPGPAGLPLASPPALASGPAAGDGRTQCRHGARGGDRVRLFARVRGRRRRTLHRLAIHRPPGRGAGAHLAPGARSEGSHHHRLGSPVRCPTGGRPQARRPDRGHPAAGGPGLPRRRPGRRPGHGRRRARTGAGQRRTGAHDRAGRAPDRRGAAPDRARLDPRGLPGAHHALAARTGGDHLRPGRQRRGRDDDSDAGGSGPRAHGCSRLGPGPRAGGAQIDA